MKKFVILFSVFLMAAMIVLPNVACATIDEAKTMVEKAEAYYQANGKEKTIQEINNPKGEFVKGELYVFAYDAGRYHALPIRLTQNWWDSITLTLPMWTENSGEKRPWKRSRRTEPPLWTINSKIPVSGKIEHENHIFQEGR